MPDLDVCDTQQVQASWNTCVLALNCRRTGNVGSSAAEGGGRERKKDGSFTQTAHRVKAWRIPTAQLTLPLLALAPLSEPAQSIEFVFCTLVSILALCLHPPSPGFAGACACACVDVCAAACTCTCVGPLASSQGYQPSWRRGEGREGALGPKTVFAMVCALSTSRWKYHAG